MAHSRPDPDRLLSELKQRSPGSNRGTLRVFFGMAPGVGKTYAMLEAAQRLARQGVDVVVGVVETHGRTETEQQLLGLDVLPRRTLDYRGVALQEFDLDAAIARKPDVLLVDELAHSNAPGSRYEKRWQDVNALLDAGLNVFTTLNVQHLESLAGIVEQVAGTPVRETVPDSVIENADELELIDLTPQDLLDRLSAGKVYLPDNARAARAAFFQHGNLSTLRQLALRRTAEWVDAQGRRGGDASLASRPLADRFLVCVSPSPLSAELLRSAKRSAAIHHADLIAVHVQRAGARAPSATDQARLLEHLRLAERLGASTVTLTAADPATELVAFARSRGVTRIIVGKTERSRLRERFTGSFVNDLIRAGGEIEVSVIRPAPQAASPTPRPSSAATPQPSRPFAWLNLAGYALSIATVALLTTLCWFTQHRLDVANLAMIYLAGVVIAASGLGRGPALFTAVLSVAALNYFFIPPIFTFQVFDTRYIITLAVMLVIGLLIADLTTRLQNVAASAREGARNALALSALSRDLANARSPRDIAHIACRHACETFNADTILAVPEPGAPGGVAILASSGAPDWLALGVDGPAAEGAPGGRELAVARWAIDHAKPAGRGTSVLPAALGRFVPLLAGDGTIGALGLRLAGQAPSPSPIQTLQIESFARQTALALERVRLLEGQQRALVEAQAERLRSALLSSVSHDLRTPLAAIAGAAGTLRESGDALDPRTRVELLDSVVEGSERLSRLIENLVFATRLESGGVELRRDWTTVEELVGAGLSRHRAALALRPFKVLLAPDLPFVRVDPALLPQVIENLLENALRFSPPDLPITLSAREHDQSVFIRIADSGPGISDTESTRIFERFYRGRQPTTQEPASARSVTTGLGLGLTICEGIVRAHGGRIWAEPTPPASAASTGPGHRGAAFVFSIPVEHPQPLLPTEALLPAPPATPPGPPTP